MFNELIKWRGQRNIVAGNYDFKVQVENDVEELFELMGYHSDDIERLVDDFMGRYFVSGLEPEDKVKVDAHCDKVVFAVNAMEELGYNAKSCMLETICEISSRNQDPIQKKEWFYTGVAGKWQKDRQQDESTLYTANYDSCKRPNGY